MAFICQGPLLSRVSLTISLHFTSTFSVFVNHQITVGSTAKFWTKLQITRNDDGLTNAGSLRYDTQNYKTATGYWMDDLEPGHYTFKVHYKGCVYFSDWTKRTGLD